MTSDMAFECLLVSPDPTVFNTIGRILQNFAISTNVCRSPSAAAEMLAEGSTDLIVVDLESEDSSEVLQQIWGTRIRRKPTVLGIAGSDRVVPGVHVILRKPVTQQNGINSIKSAYHRMVRDYRKHTRFAVMTPVIALDENHTAVRVTVTNIGEGGVGLTSGEKLRIGSTLSFAIRLPDLCKDLSLQARVLWTRRYGAAGCEFANISPLDFQVLRAWLESRYRIKEPVVQL